MSKVICRLSSTVVQFNHQDMNFAGQAFLNRSNVHFLYRPGRSKGGRRNWKLYMIENLAFLVGI